ncbi:MAG TPA: hypothetical protein VME92_07630 [Acetobacteraceae bacterium]|nr:hypothetical protein [Acetobacteraceae bacterium]
MAILTVGPGQQFATIAAAVAASQDGDTIDVKAGTYVNDFATIRDSITLQAVGGRVNLVATQSPPDGKAIVTLGTATSNITINGFSFSGASVPDNNGAGIRYEGGTLTLNNDYFHDNQEGLLGGYSSPGVGTININHSEFAHNGAGDGYTHNLYVGDIAALNINNSYFTNAVVGHEIKSRAESTTINNTRIQDGPTGTASYDVDLPNGGNLSMHNDVVEKGPNAQNPIMISYGEEGGLHAGSTISITNDTFLNDDPSSSVVLLQNDGTGTATISNDKTWGLSSSQIAHGAANVSGVQALASEPALDTSAPFTSGSTGSDSLVIKVTAATLGQAAAPRFAVAVGDQQVGGPLTVTAAAGQTETFTLKGNWAAGTHHVLLHLLDAGAGAAMQVQGITWDGQSVSNHIAWNGQALGHAGSMTLAGAQAFDSFHVTDTTAIAHS